MAPTPPTRFSFDEGNDVTVEDPELAFAERARLVARTWRALERPAGHMSLETPEGSVVLGVLTRVWTIGRGRRSYEFAPEPGDVVAFTRRRSVSARELILNVRFAGTLCVSHLQRTHNRTLK